MESKIRRALATELEKKAADVEEGMKYGVVHLVGELNPGKEPPVEVEVAIFENGRYKFKIVEGDSLFFMVPTEESNPRRLFFEIWRFITGREKEEELETGKRITGPLQSVLQRKGFEVLWVNTRTVRNAEYVEVWTKKGSERYNLLFQRDEGGYVLINIENL